MKYRIKRRDKKIISLDNEDFAVLENFDKGTSTYTFTYSVNIPLALEEEIANVEIVVKPINLPKPKGIFNLNNFNRKPTPFTLANNIQALSALKKDTKISNINSRYDTKISDFTTKINNSSTRTFVPNRTSFFKTALPSTIAQQNKIEPVLQLSTLASASINKNINSLSIESILLDGKDPSDVVQKFVAGPNLGIQGLVSPAQERLKLSSNALRRTQLTLESTKVRNSNQAVQTAVIPIYSKDNETVATISKEFTFEPGDFQDASQFLVSFNLLNKSGIIAEKEERKVDHAFNVKVVQTPILPPSISSITAPARNLLTITQNDPLAKSVDIYRKEFKRTQTINEQDYVFIDNVAVTKIGGPVPFEDLFGNASDIIYRVIPKGEQNQAGSAFTNKVVKAYRFGLSRERTARLLYAGITAQSTEEGIVIDIIGLPAGVAGIKLLARDRTRGDTDFRVIPSLLEKTLTVAVVDDVQTYRFLDISAKENNVIEYAVMLLFENGDEEISTSREIYNNIAFSKGVVDTFVSEPIVLQGGDGIDVQFVISSKINDGNISTLKKLLEQQGQSSVFASELENEKKSLNKLIAHEVRRIDLTTGENVYFRNLTDPSFSDEQLRSIDDIPAPQPGRSYRYIISALLRAPETLFEKNFETFTNAIGISVKTLPIKFRHPIVEKFGNIVSPTSLKTHYSERPFDFGNVGNFVSKDISVDISRPRVYNTQVTRFNRKTNIIKWNVLGDKNLLDHFLVIVDRLGDEEIIGTVHTTFNSNVIEYIDKETLKEPGSYRYKIVPVQKDYTHGPADETEEVL